MLPSLVSSGVANCPHPDSHHSLLPALQTLWPINLILFLFLFLFLSSLVFKPCSSPVLSNAKLGEVFLPMPQGQPERY